LTFSDEALMITAQSRDSMRVVILRQTSQEGEKRLPLTLSHTELVISSFIWRLDEVCQKAKGEASYQFKLSNFILRELGLKAG
ncbi:hypothetical protein DTG28_23425, partial [Salmonella enterica subsp. salamae]|nr:hypothetical protein [Salmonella enterica subsp. salamae]